MDNLLSGLIGAVIATVLSIVCLFFSEEIRRRREVYLAVVKYIDDVYIRLQAVFAYTHFKYTSESLPIYDIEGLSESDIHRLRREVTELILSHGIRSQVAIVYGENTLLYELAGLFDTFLEVNRKLGRATRAAWLVKEKKEVFALFEKKIDPARYYLQDSYRRETSVFGVIKTCLTCCSTRRVKAEK